jgi:hypothetical protein
VDLALISPQSREGPKDIFHLPLIRQKDRRTGRQIKNKYSLRPLRLGGEKYY